ncbi:MAG: hypothetical protein ACREVR_04445, partial [Burkholderiales bacterium]
MTPAPLAALAAAATMLARERRFSDSGSPLAGRRAGARCLVTAAILAPVVVAVLVVIEVKVTSGGVLSVLRRAGTS